MKYRGVLSLAFNGLALSLFFESRGKSALEENDFLVREVRGETLEKV